MRILIALLLTLAGLAAAAPSTSAVAICSNQQDVQDLDLDDSWLVRSQCTTENLISYDCDTDVRVYSSGEVYRSTSCECLVCPGPYLSAAAPALPCHTVGSPVLDGGFGVECSTGLAECHAVVATFGTVWDFLSPSVGCSTPLWPPYDCVQDCDGPPTE